MGKVVEGARKGLHIFYDEDLWLYDTLSIYDVTLHPLKGKVIKSR